MQSGLSVRSDRSPEGPRDIVNIGLFRRKVSIVEAEKFLKDKDLAFMFETSAKTSENV